MKHKNNKWVVEEWKDLEMTARFGDIVWDNSPHGFDFEVYEQVGFEQNPITKEYDVPIYEREGATESGDYSENELEDAQPYLTGMIKWDGCSHFYFGNEGYIHLCGLDQIEKLQKVLQRLINRSEQKGVERI